MPELRILEVRIESINVGGETVSGLRSSDREDTP